MTRRIAVLFLISASLLLGCSRPDRPTGAGSGAAARPTSGDWIINRIDTEPESLNPLISTTTNAQYIQGGANNSHVYESMLQWEPADWVTPRPLLAESRPEVSADHLTYTFTIRDGVTWHDGQPFTAADVLFTFKAAVTPSVDDAPIRSYLTDLLNVELLDGRKLRFTVRKPYFMNEIVLGQFMLIMPKHVFDPQGLLDGVKFPNIVSADGKNNPKLKQFGEQFNKHPNNRAPIGTGPYKFDRWDTGKEILLARNDQYWGKKGYLDKIVYRIISDGTAALTALKAGEVDMNPRLLPIQYAQQTSGAAFENQFAKSPYTIPTYYLLAWNEERPFFKDKRVRQALTMLVDRQQIIETLRFGLAKIATSHFNPGTTDHNTGIQALPYDPKRAAELLDEAGWVDHNEDGIRDKDGVPFRFEMLGSSSSTFTGQLLPILKEEFRKAGIDMTERRIEFTVFIASMRDHRFDAGASAWSADLVQDPYQIWHSNSIANRGSNYISFRNAESDRMLEQARTEFDHEKRKQIYWKWQELIHEEQPYTFLFYPQEAAAYHKRFQNVSWLPARPGYDLNIWFVPKVAQRYTATNAQ